MRTILHINNSICSSLEQLRSFFSMDLTPETQLYEDLLTLQRDGELALWLAESGLEEEVKLSKALMNLPEDLCNSEIIANMKQIFVGVEQRVQKPHFSSYFELKQIRCLTEDSEIELIPQPQKYRSLLKHHPHFQNPLHHEILHVYDGYVTSESNKKCWLHFFLDFKIIKTDDEVFKIFFHGTHMLSLNDKKVGQIVTIEVCPYMFTMEHEFQLAIEDEPIGLILLYEIKKKTIRVKNTEFKMIFVEGGEFTMGGVSKIQVGMTERDEYPPHQVKLSDYYIGETEVTQELWEAIMDNNPSYFKGAKRPVESVSWDNCRNFVNELNKLTGLQFRLPTEAEWEYAAIGGKYGYRNKNFVDDSINDIAWYFDNSNGSTHDVKTKRGNELGLYDMLGNVYEWCNDWYDSYSSEFQLDPQGPVEGFAHVSRGGCWFYDAKSCRVSHRNYNAPSAHSIGFRLAL